MRSAASTSRIRARVGSIARKSSAERLVGQLGDRPGHFDAGRSSADDHERQPAGDRFGDLRSRSAVSNASRIFRRIDVASSIVLRPGASGSHSGWPK